MATDRDQRLITPAPFETGTLNGLRVWTVEKLHDVAAPGVNVHDLVKIAGERGLPRALLCGERGGPFYRRLDGLQCNFKIVVGERKKQLLVMSYVFHIESPAPPRSPGFIRWEYATVRNENVDAVKEPLAHIHPGHDHVRLPAPVLSPKELIAAFLAIELWT